MFAPVVCLNKLSVGVLLKLYFRLLNNCADDRFLINMQTNLILTDFVGFLVYFSLQVEFS